MNRLNEAYDYFYQEAKDMGHDHYADFKKKLADKQAAIEKEVNRANRFNRYAAPIGRSIQGGALGAFLGTSTEDLGGVLLGGLAGAAAGGIGGAFEARAANRHNERSLAAMKANDAKNTKIVDKIVDDLKKKLKRNPTQAEIMDAAEEHEKANKKYW